MSWTDQLRVATWRGQPFGVFENDDGFGRRLAVHEYPFRDKAWVEDIGRSPRKISFRGFLLEGDATYSGGPVLVQKDEFIGRCEQAGPGQLVHPTLGRLTVSLIDVGIRQRADQGRYFELSLSFIEAGERVFPSLIAATGDSVAQASLDANGAASADFVKRATSDLAQGAAVVNQAVSTAATWARMAQRLGNDATNLTSLVSKLSGNFGRYFGSSKNSGFTGITSATIGSASTVQSLISQGTVARNQINLTVNTLNSVAGKLSL